MVFAFIAVGIIVMGVTCILTFQAQFNKWEQQVEEEYQKLYPVMERRRDVLSSFFSADKVTQWGGDEVFNHSLLSALEELSGEGKDRNLILAKHALVRNLLIYGKENAEEENQQGQESQEKEEKWQGEKLQDTWQKLEGYQQVLEMEEDYLHAIEPLQMAIHTYNVLRQVFPASFVAKILKKEAMAELR